MPLKAVLRTDECMSYLLLQVMHAGRKKDVVVHMAFQNKVNTAKVK